VYWMASSFSTMHSSDPPIHHYHGLGAQYFFSGSILGTNTPQNGTS
jgi:hypothetical protein